MVCNCTLAGTAACLVCPRYQQYLGDSNIYPPTYLPSGNKKITEKFDKDGKLIERITEE